MAQHMDGKRPLNPINTEMGVPDVWVIILRRLRDTSSPTFRIGALQLDGIFIASGHPCNMRPEPPIFHPFRPATFKLTHYRALGVMTKSRM
jgi:hypothetical protein